MQTKAPLTFQILFLLFFAAISPGWAQTTLPLENPGFENGLTGWKAQPAAASTLQVLPEAASMGAMGLRVTPGDQASLSGNSMPAAPGHTYRLTFWGRGRESGIVVKLQFLGQDGKPVAAIPLATKNFRTETKLIYEGRFEKYILQAIAPTDAASVEVALDTKVKTPVDVDDFVLEDVIDAAESPVAVDALLADLKAHPRQAKTPAKIMLKLDDLLGMKDKEGVDPRWQKLVDFIRAKGIKANIGIICNSLDTDNQAYFQWIKDQQATGLFEFWNHGYDHKSWKEGNKTLTEFCGATYEHQKDHLTRSDQLAKDKLGITFTAFGAPFNAIDQTTWKVLSEEPDIKIILWVEKDQQPPGKISLQRVCAANIEAPVFRPNYERYVEGYVHNRNLNYFLMQGHPGSWRDQDFDQFVKIIDFLTAQGADFVKMDDFLTGENRLGVAP